VQQPSGLFVAWGCFCAGLALKPRPGMQIENESNPEEGEFLSLFGERLVKRETSERANMLGNQ